MAVAKDDKDKTATEAPEQSAEDKSRAAMGKVAPSEGGTVDTSGGYYVPEAGADPDSVTRVVKHLPKYLQDRIGGVTPEELAADRAAYAEEVNAKRNPQGPRATDGASDEEMAARTGQPIGDGKSTGAPSADDPGSPLREDPEVAARAAGRRSAAGQSGIQGRTATPPAKVTTEGK